MKGCLSGCPFVIFAQNSCSWKFCYFWSAGICFFATGRLWFYYRIRL